jgi:ATP/maltotriose-dependent transcriptional regulator MalT
MGEFLMDATRRRQILTAYAGHTGRFDEIAKRLDRTAGLFAQDKTEAVPRAGTELLSDREQQVLGLIAQGLSNREISTALAITPETVKSHVQHILQRLSTRNRAHAVSVAYLWGLLQVGAPSTDDL